MRILAFESSAKAASVALLTDGVLTAESYQNDAQTHSRTLMKLAKDLLDNCGLSPAELDYVAWANGPGSFTGVRIGTAAAKGLCWGAELPCVPVSTLEAMAWNAVDLDGVICCCMDARRSQVYNALFRAEHGSIIRLRPDRAISLEELAEDLRTLSERRWLGIICMKPWRRRRRADMQCLSLRTQTGSRGASRTPPPTGCLRSNIGSSEPPALPWRPTRPRKTAYKPIPAR